MKNNIRIYGYLRVSTEKQNLLRAKNDLIEFIDRMGLQVACWFIEKKSGATLYRPELLRLLDVTMPNDIILVEQVDRLSRLNNSDWEKLKNIIRIKNLKVVSLDLPTSHLFLNKDMYNTFTEQMLIALNNMMLDILAAIARKDYEDRRYRQLQGIKKAQLDGKYKGRPINKQLHEKIKFLLQEHKSYNQIENLIGCSRHTISKVSKNLKLNLSLND